MPITFADVLPVRQVGSHQYTTTFQDEWCIGTVPNGGYVTSAFMLAASEHMRLTHSKRNQPHVLNLHLEFFKRTAVGEALFKVKDVKIGSRVSNLHLVLAQKQNADSTEYVDEVEGYLTMSNINSESGMSQVTNYKLLPEPLPVTIRALPSGQDKNYARRYRDPFSGFRRAMYNLETYIVRPARKPKDFPKAMIDQWLRFSPPGHNSNPGRWTNDALGYLVDAFPQVIESYINPDIEQAVIGHELTPDEVKALRTNREHGRLWYPTLLLNLDVKKALPEEGVEWLFVRLQAKQIRNGRYDLQLEVWDEQNDLVALSTHAVLIVDSSRNTTRNSKQASKL